MVKIFPKFFRSDRHYYRSLLSITSDQIMRGRNFVFTINYGLMEDGITPFPVTDLLPEEFPSWLTYCTWQLECGEEEGTMHHQGYLEVQGQKSFAQLHEIPGFERARFAVRGGTQAQAVEYAQKEDTRIEGPWVFGALKEQGRRSDLEEIRREILDGASLRVVQENHFASFVRYGRAFKEYKRQCTRPRTFKTIVILIVGPSGVGKSRYATELSRYLGTVYKLPKPKGSGTYWDDYDGHDVTFIDEFDGNLMRPTDFNELADRYEYVVPVHGGAGHQFVSRYLIICSNYLPKFWWRKRSDVQLKQTLRRIDVFVPLLLPVPVRTAFDVLMASREPRESRDSRTFPSSRSKNYIEI